MTTVRVRTIGMDWTWIRNRRVELAFGFEGWWTLHWVNRKIDMSDWGVGMEISFGAKCT